MKRNSMKIQKKKERINERMSGSSYVVPFVTNDGIEPATEVHELLSLLFFSDSLIVLRLIKGAIGLYGKQTLV